MSVLTEPVFTRDFAINQEMAQVPQEKQAWKTNHEQRKQIRRAYDIRGSINNLNSEMLMATMSHLQKPLPKFNKTIHMCSRT